MAIEDARAALQQHYQALGYYPNKIIAVEVGTSPDNTPCLDILVNRLFAAAAPKTLAQESKPGVGYQGYRCISYKGPQDPGNVISDSGEIAP